jgi:small nuclear ribonucleoprotein (snRNP)-like protein
LERDVALTDCPPAVTGVLKGYDQLLNVVLDETTEYLRGMQHVSLMPGLRLSRVLVADPEDPLRITDEKRTLGLVVRILGKNVTLKWVVDDRSLACRCVEELP